MIARSLADIHCSVARKSVPAQLELFEQTIYLLFAVGGAQGDPQARSSGRHRGRTDRTDQHTTFPQATAQVQSAAGIAPDVVRNACFRRLFRLGREQG